MERIDVAVIGGGVTGLASARAIAPRGASVCLLERHPRPGMDTSTHNSGVIHAGLYYPAGTLKARLCVEGRDLLYEFCARYGVPHVRSGKLIVAHDEHEIRELEALQRRGAGNGVDGLEIVDRAFIVVARAGREYAVRALVARQRHRQRRRVRQGAAADRHDAGVMFLPGTKLIGADRQADGMVLRPSAKRSSREWSSTPPGCMRTMSRGCSAARRSRSIPCRGEYAEFTPAKRSLVNGLVYPLPHRSGHGLGVHLVRTTGGQVWLGPTIRYQERKDDYENDRLPLEAFAEPARRLIDGVTLDDLRLSGSGIRAKLHPPTESFADFLIRRDRVNPAIVQASGIDSPGLTSSLAIGNLVRDLVSESLVETGAARPATSASSTPAASQLLVRQRAVHAAAPPQLSCRPSAPASARGSTPSRRAISRANSSHVHCRS